MLPVLRISPHVCKTEGFAVLPHAARMNGVHSCVVRLQRTTNAGDRARTGTALSGHGILSPGRLPVSPLRRVSPSARPRRRENARRQCFLSIAERGGVVKLAFLFYKVYNMIALKKTRTAPGT